MSDPIRTIHQRLRAETAAEHRALEDAVGFDLERPSIAAACHMLERFYGVLSVLEPALVSQLGEDVMARRRRLPRLERDLVRLGLDPRRVPACSRARRLATDTPAAWGALYVFEGSSLGGTLIARSLETQPDWPLKGDNYFASADRTSGSAWKGFLADLAAAPVDHDRVIEGARDTFTLLRAWMPREQVAA